MRTTNAVWLLGAAIVAGCATTTVFTSTWRNPETKPVTLAGQKVIALVISTQDTTRRTGEDRVAAQITAKGGHGVPAWTILPTADMQNEEKARAAFSQSGAAAVLTMEIVPVDPDSRSSNIRVSVGTSTHRSFWSNYRWAWNSTWHSGPAPNRNVWVESLLYGLERDELLWAGRSRTVNPRAVATVFEEVADAAAREMERAGLLMNTGQ
jgi:hypothetical protein